jgi:AcrR family transcriptional regulator
MPALGKTKKEVVSEFRSLEIIEAARTVFAAKGFNNATMDDIAEAAGVAKGTVYLYFPSKREIFLETFRQGTLALQEEVARNMAAEADTEGKIRAFIRTRLDYSERNRGFIRIYYTEFNNMLIHPAPVQQEFQDLYNRQAHALARVIEDGIERKQVRRMDAPAAARFIYDSTRGFIAQRLLGWSASSVEEDANFVFEVIWKGISCAKR